MPDRRAFLRICAGLLATPALARAAAPTPPVPVNLAAAWQTEVGYQVGILAPVDSGLRIHTAIDVPTRAHALFQEPGGSLLAIARRPGDWLLRWDAQGRPLAWRWIEAHRAFTGHVVGDGVRLYVSETDLDSGAGLIGVRDAWSLEKLAEWPTHGIDPHQLLWDAGQGASRTLFIANGGVPTRPETGRLKRDLERMDSSLVRIDAGSGAMLGQWRLDDRRLSLRHLAWQRERLGIALQAEHDSAEARAAAPVLALFDGDSLRAVAAPQALAGYGGDIVATRVSTPAANEPGFAVSCPRAQGIALFAADGGWRGLIPLAEACALTTSTQGVWAGGRWQALALNAAQASDAVPISGIRLDNHWLDLR
jgi:uncharacterized protein